MGKKRRRRNWSDEEKRMICAQTKLPGVSVSQVARRYDVNTNLVFIWLRNERYNVAPEEIDVARFLPVEMIDAAVEPQAEVTETELDIALTGGHRLTVRGPFDPDRLAILIRKLAS
jgi:transposase